MTAKKVGKSGDVIRVVRKAGKVTSEEMVRRKKMKVLLFDLMIEAHRLNLLDDPNYEDGGFPVIQFGFVTGQEDALYNNQNTPYGKSFGVVFKMAKTINSLGGKQNDGKENVVLNVESSLNTYEYVASLFKDLEKLILKEKEEELKREAAKDKAKSLLTAEERKHIGLHF